MKICLGKELFLILSFTFSTVFTAQGMEKVCALAAPGKVITFLQIEHYAKGRLPEAQLREAPGSLIASWWLPKSLAEYQALFAPHEKDGSPTVFWFPPQKLENEEEFNRFIMERKDSSDLRILSLYRFNFEQKEYAFYEFLHLKKGIPPKSGIITFCASDDGWKAAPIPPALNPLYQLCWKYPVRGVRFFLSGDTQLLRSILLSDDAQIKKAQKIRNSCLDSDGVLDLQRLQACFGMSRDALHNAPVVKHSKVVVLTTEQRETLVQTLAAQKISEKIIENVITVLQTDGRLSAAVVLRDSGGLSLPEAVALIESVVGKGGMKATDTNGPLK